ncbi:hypothetical protein SO802_005828 [Lithocarpus litseifolius]|uniref:Reverse transcriptase domain-containing protein n=1 Tax=Lithocarpus litseifolius TaxID=425828 RepID=A0AAW2DNF5_9ROSI
MKALKAPGLDGFPVLFSKHYWDIVGDQLTLAVQGFSSNGWLQKEFNKTFISLIPKKKDPAQVAFVPNRWINENVVLAHEIVHTFKHTRKKKGYLGIKLDFQKTYDRMEWSFLIAVLKAFGFSSNFTKLIHQCLLSVEFTLLLNGGQCLSFLPSQGLRQGDPLSPYLFILGSEVLLRLLNREVSQNRLSGVKVSNTALPISKLCYVDDIILFCKAKSAEIAILKSCLEKFWSWLGQRISMEKSCCFPSKGILLESKCKIQSALDSDVMVIFMSALKGGRLGFQKLLGLQPSSPLQIWLVDCFKKGLPLCSEQRNWDTAKLNYFFDELVVELILSILIPVFQKDDCWAWTASNSGLFFVKFAYWLSRVESPPSNIDVVRDQIWKTKLHEHFKMLLWRVAANLLPSKEIISRFNESMDLCFLLYSSAVETTLHLFTVCPFSKSLWYQSQWGLRMEVLNFESPSEFVNFLLSSNFTNNLLSSQREDFLLFGAILCDVVWKQRNRSIFENMDINLEGVAARIFSLFVEHKSARPPLFDLKFLYRPWVGVL